jgi:DNA helicase IV
VSPCAGGSRSSDGELTAYLDEHLDDPDAADVASGIPDPVLAEIGAARRGAMREIVATIQAEQDVVIRAPMDRPLVVQGGPGTGKTAVALHRFRNSATVGTVG